MDVRLNRQKDLGLKIPEKVVVVGAGGLGSWTALALALAGVKELYLFDDDKIEEHNLNRMPYAVDEIGEFKVKALTKLILRSVPNAKVFPFKAKFDPLLLFDSVEVVVDATDDFKAQKEIYKWAKENRVKYYRVGSRGNHITITRSVPEWEDDEEEDEDLGRCGIVIPQWVAPQMIAAGFVVAAVCGALEKDDIIKNIKEV